MTHPPSTASSKAPTPNHTTISAGGCGRCCKPRGNTKYRLCDPCREKARNRARILHQNGYFRARYAARMAEGVCAFCDSPQAPHSSAYCEQHLADRRAYYHRKKKGG